MYVKLFIRYDVWLGNFRGNGFSDSHETFDANGKSKKFWDFSFDEHGR